MKLHRKIELLTFFYLTWKFLSPFHLTRYFLMLFKNILVYTYIFSNYLEVSVYVNDKEDLLLLGYRG